MNTVFNGGKYSIFKYGLRRIPENGEKLTSTSLQIRTFINAGRLFAAIGLAAMPWVTIG
jgi:hypothetical protein